MRTAGSACGFGCILGSRYTEQTSQSRLSAERGPSGESQQHSMTEGTISCISQQCCQKTLALLLTPQPMCSSPPFRCLAHTLCLQFRETAHLIVSFESGRPKAQAQNPHLSNEQLNEQVVHSVSVDFSC